MSEIPIETELKKIIAEIAGVEEHLFSLDSLLARDIGIDSLKAMELLAEIETRYNIKIEEEKIFNLETVGELVGLIKNYL